ncbi:MAG: hypothetical protein RLZ95_368 [Bacteroidota bacterium]|jgi:AraC-like DNA-binding protein
MKPFFEDIEKKRGQQDLIAFEIEQNKLEFFWHYHPEYELTLIQSGKGNRMIGDSLETFHNGDLVLMGPGLPHAWVSNHDLNGKCKAFVIQFSQAFINRFIGLDELSHFKSLLSKSNLGIAFNENNTELVNKLMIQLPLKKGMERITIFLQLMDELSKMKTKLLASSFYQPLKGIENEKRINKVFQYIQKHATEPLTIQKAASVLHLTPSAFCKFFKRVTGKTFSDYVNDIRIANVCTHLIATDKQVSTIAFENGFETLTYFNRVFLRKKGMKPSEYRRCNN